MLLDILRHVEKTLQVSQRVIGFAFIDLAVEFALAGIAAQLGDSLGDWRVGPASS